MIARVRRVHDRVIGTLPDGTRPTVPTIPNCSPSSMSPRSTASCARICATRTQRLPGAVQDRYLAVYADDRAPTGRGGRADLAARDRRLLPPHPARTALRRAHPRCRAVRCSRVADEAAMEPMRAVVFAAGRDLLPDWAAAMHGAAPRLRRPRDPRRRAGDGARAALGAVRLTSRSRHRPRSSQLHPGGRATADRDRRRREVDLAPPRFSTMRHPNPLLAIAVGFCLTVFAFGPRLPSEPQRTATTAAA